LPPRRHGGSRRPGGDRRPPLPDRPARGGRRGTGRGDPPGHRAPLRRRGCRPLRSEGAGGGEGLRLARPLAVEPAAEPPVRFDPAPAPPASEAKAAEASRRENGTDLFAATDPAYRAVEALVRILVRKGILEKGEFLQEILREVDGELRS